MRSEGIWDSIFLVASYFSASRNVDPVDYPAGARDVFVGTLSASSLVFSRLRGSVHAFNVRYIF